MIDPNIAYCVACDWASELPVDQILDRYGITKEQFDEVLNGKWSRGRRPARPFVSFNSQSVRRA